MTPVVSLIYIKSETIVDFIEHHPLDYSGGHLTNRNF